MSASLSGVLVKTELLSDRDLIDIAAWGHASLRSRAALGRHAARTGPTELTSASITNAAMMPIKISMTAPSFFPPALPKAEPENPVRRQKPFAPMEPCRQR
jgi:hypothetical protein